MEIGRILKSLKVKQCKEIYIILQHSDFLEWLFFLIVLILFRRQPMEALFSNHNLIKTIHFISRVNQKHKNQYVLLLSRFYRKH